MTTKIVTTLIAGALLAGSATAAPIPDGCHSRIESTTSGGSPVLVVVTPVRPLADSVGAFKQRAPHIILLKPFIHSIQ